MFNKTQYCGHWFCIFHEYDIEVYFAENAPEFNSTVQVCSLCKRKGFYLMLILLRNLFSRGGKNLWLQIKAPSWTAAWFNSQWHSSSWKVQMMQMNICSASWQTSYIILREFQLSSPVPFMLLSKNYHFRTTSFSTTYTQINFCWCGCC